MPQFANYLRDAIKFELRKGNSLFLVDESLAFLRLNILVTMFDREMGTAPNTGIAYSNTSGGLRQT